MSGHAERELAEGELIASKQVTWREIAAQWTVLGGLVLAVTVGGAAWTEAPQSAIAERPGRPDIVDAETRHLEAGSSAHRIEDPSLQRLSRPRVVALGFEERDPDERAEELADAMADPWHIAPMLPASPITTGSVVQTAQCP